MTATTVLTRTGTAEWHRIWSVRSSWIFAAATAVVVVGFGLLIGLDTADDPSGPPADVTAWDAGQLTGMFALFGILAMSVVTSTADHGTGGIVPTLQWTPRRAVLLGARAGVISSTMTALALLSVTAASVVVRTLVPEVGLPAREGAEVLGGLAFIYATGALLGIGLGLALRSTAGALVTVIALMLVLPMLVAQLPYEWTTTLATHLPGSGALFLIFGEGPSDDMTTTSARITLAAWAVTALLAGGWRLLRSDANR
jgi:ABC-2 type transport system permease protein